MNKEQISTKIKEILSTLDYDKTKELSEKEISDELKEIDNKRQELIIESSLLEQKLNNDENYPSFTYIRNQSFIHDVENRITLLEQKETENKADILSINYRISYLDNEIEAANSLLSDEQRNLDELGRKFRSLGENPDPEVDKRIREQIEYHQKGITFLMNELNTYTEEKEALIKDLNDANAKAKDLENKKQKYNTLLENAKLREQNNNQIDIVKKREDERKLLELKAIIQSFNNREAYLSFDFSIELATLLSEYENTQIKEEELLSRLKEIKDKIPLKIANKSYPSMDKELEENNKSQADLISQIAFIEQKLSDEQNYTPSLFAIEVFNDEIASLENIIVKHDADITKLDAEILKYENDKKSFALRILDSQIKIEKLEQANNDLRLKAVILSERLTPQELKGIEKEKNANKKKIDNLKKKIESLQKLTMMADTNISSNKKYKQSLERNKNQDLKELEDKKNTLSDRTTIDKDAIAKDKEKLALLKSELEILKIRQSAISYDYEAELIELIESLQTNLKSSEPEIKEEIVLDENVTNDVPMKNEVLKSLDNEKTPIVSFKKAKQKVVEKIKDKKFMLRAKASIAALIVALGLGYATAKITNDETDTQIGQTDQTINSENDLNDEFNDIIFEDQIKDEEVNKTNYEIALEVIKGKWSSGQERKEMLTQAGYDYNVIQGMVNEILRENDLEHQEIKADHTELLDELGISESQGRTR